MLLFDDYELMKNENVLVQNDSIEWIIYLFVLVHAFSSII